MHISMLGLRGVRARVGACLRPNVSSGLGARDVPWRSNVSCASPGHGCGVLNRAGDEGTAAQVDTFYARSTAQVACAEGFVEVIRLERLSSRCA